MRDQLFFEGQRHRGHGPSTGSTRSSAPLAPRYGGAIAVIAALLLVVIVPLWINSDRIDKPPSGKASYQPVPK